MVVANYGLKGNEWIRKREKKWEGKWTVRKSDRSTNFTPLNVIYRTFISHPFQCLHPIKRFWNIIGSFFFGFVEIVHVGPSSEWTPVGHFLNDITITVSANAIFEDFIPLFLISYNTRKKKDSVGTLWNRNLNYWQMLVITQLISLKQWYKHHN